MKEDQMSEKNTKREEVSLEEHAFPFPKLIQTFDYFFPKEKGAPNIFTMETLKKFSRYAPYLTLVIFIIIIASFFRDALLTDGDDKIKYYMLGFFDLGCLLISFFGYLWWIGSAILAKMVKRSPTIPLVMSFYDPLRLFGILCVIHIAGFILGAISHLGK